MGYPCMLFHKLEMAFYTRRYSETHNVRVNFMEDDGKYTIRVPDTCKTQLIVLHTNREIRSFCSLVE